MFQESFSQMDTFDKASEIAFLVGLVLAVVFLVVFIIMKKYRPAGSTRPGGIFIRAQSHNIL